MIVLEMKCPQLSKPEATAARNENSIGDRMEKKPWEKPVSQSVIFIYKARLKTTAVGQSAVQK